MPVAKVNEDTGGIRVECLPADDEQGTRNGTERAHGAWDTEHTGSDLDL